MGSDEAPARFSFRRRLQVGRGLGVCCVLSCLLGAFGQLSTRRGLKVAAAARLRGGGPRPRTFAAAVQQQQLMSPPRELPFLYGTAWKKEATTELVVLAVKSGFVGIDTACQPKHYREDLVGKALDILEEDGIPREAIWLQTKFTPFPGQDPNDVPYDPSAPLETQVEQSIAKSLDNLKTSHIDSLVLHSPLRRFEDTLTVWRTFERAVDKGLVRQLGVSNCYDIRVFREIYDRAKHKPKVLQNRFYDKSGFDRDLRAFCKTHGVVYQTFWTLTANGSALRSRPIRAAAARLGATPPQILFAWLISQGHQPLTGTKSQKHMKQDLLAPALELTPTELRDIASLFDGD